MARNERGVISMIFRDFIKSLTSKTGDAKLIGEDFYGTKYYETPPRAGSYKRAARHFEPVTENNYEQEMPAEWEAWLRHRRREAPTKEEVEENYRIILMKRENAAKLLETHSGKEVAKLTPPKYGEIPGNFPAYEEYHNYGKTYKPKIED